MWAYASVGQGQGEETEAAQEEALKSAWGLRHFCRLRCLQMPELSFALGEEDTVLLEAEVRGDSGLSKAPSPHIYIYIYIYIYTYTLD